MQIDNDTTTRKYSKWSIFAFCYFLLNVFGLPFTDPDYSYFLAYLYGVFLIVIEMLIAWKIMISVRKNNLNGYNLAKISFYGLLLINLIYVIVPIFLIKSEKEVEIFATSVTPSVIQSDLTKLRSLSIDPLSAELAYESDLKDFTDAIAASGEINKCDFTEVSFSNASAGFYSVYKGYKFGVQGKYAVRCFGSKGYIDITAFLRKVNSEWKISSIKYVSSDPDLQDKDGGSEN